MKIANKSIADKFRAEVLAMIDELSNENNEIDFNPAHADFKIASSTSIPWQNESIDLIVTSPPYCTRIDYAVATMPELAILGYDLNGSFDELRRSLIGSTTVPKNAPSIKNTWGNTCNNLLNNINTHSSKASSTYYLKNHINYFNSMYQSIIEVSRVLKPNAVCIMVVQDSYYKDLHNDLPTILSEMSENCNLRLKRREDFLTKNNLGDINPSSQKYREASKATESVLCFQKH